GEEVEPELSGMLGGPVGRQHPVLTHRYAVLAHRAPERLGAAQRGMDEGNTLHAGTDVGDVTMTEADDVLGRRDCGGGVVDADGGAARQMEANGDDRHVQAAEELELLVVHRDVDRDDSVDTLPQHGAGEGEPD